MCFMVGVATPNGKWMEFFRSMFMELFRLIRSLPSQSPDKSGVMGRIVPNRSAFRKRNGFGKRHKCTTVL